MSGAQLEAAFQAHKVPILATVGAGVAVLAFARRKSAAASSAATATDTSLSTGGQLANTAGAGGSVYDSTSTDLASFLSPQLGSIAAQLSDLQAAQNAANPVPVPVPVAHPTTGLIPVTPPKAPAPHVAPKPSPVPVAHTPAHKIDQWITVGRGQTLSGIAAKYGSSVTVGTIAAQNGIANPNRIYAGQKLHVVG